MPSHRARTDGDGRYEVWLEPGQYQLATSGGYGRRQLSVTEEHQTDVDISVPLTYRDWVDQLTWKRNDLAAALRAAAFESLGARHLEAVRKAGRRSLPGNVFSGFENREVEAVLSSGTTLKGTMLSEDRDFISIEESSGDVVAINKGKVVYLRASVANPTR